MCNIPKLSFCWPATDILCQRSFLHTTKKSDGHVFSSRWIFFKKVNIPKHLSHHLKIKFELYYMEQLENKKKLARFMWIGKTMWTLPKKRIDIKGFPLFFPDGVACISLPRCVTLSHPPTSRWRICKDQTPFFKEYHYFLKNFIIKKRSLNGFSFEILS